MILNGREPRVLVRLSEFLDRRERDKLQADVSDFCRLEKQYLQLKLKRILTYGELEAMKSVRLNQTGSRVCELVIAALNKDPTIKHVIYTPKTRAEKMNVIRGFYESEDGK